VSKCKTSISDEYTPDKEKSDENFTSSSDIDSVVNKVNELAFNSRPKHNQMKRSMQRTMIKNNQMKQAIK